MSWNSATKTWRDQTAGFGVISARVDPEVFAMLRAKAQAAAARRAGEVRKAEEVEEAYRTAGWNGRAR